MLNFVCWKLLRFFGMTESARFEVTEPIRLTVKVKPASLGSDESMADVTSNEKFLFVHDTSQKKSVAPSAYPVSHVYPSFATREDIYNQDLSRLVNLVAEGIDATFVVIGTESSGRRSLLLERGGLLYSALYGLQSRLSQRKEAAEGDSEERYRCTLKLRCSRIINEKLRDVITANSGAFPMIEETAEGLCFPGLSAMSIGWNPIDDIWKQISTLIKDLDESLHSRETLVTIYEVTQGDTTKNQYLYSRLIIINTLAMDCLGLDRDAVQTKNGYHAYRSAFALQDVLDIVPGKSLVDYSQASLTWLLKEALTGGSVVCAVLVCLQQQQGKLSKAVMDVAAKLCSFKTHPVPMDNRLLGLMRTIRGQALLATRVGLLDSTTKLPSDTLRVIEAQTKYIAEMESQLSKDQAQRLAVTEERDQLLLDLLLSKEQLNESLTEKLKLEKELLSFEEVHTGKRPARCETCASEMLQFPAKAARVLSMTGQTDRFESPPLEKIEDPEFFDETRDLQNQLEMAKANSWEAHRQNLQLTTVHSPTTSVSHKPRVLGSNQVSHLRVDAAPVRNSSSSAVPTFSADVTDLQDKLARAESRAAQAERSLEESKKKRTDEKLVASKEKRISELEKENEKLRQQIQGTLIKSIKTNPSMGGNALLDELLSKLVEAANDSSRKEQNLQAKVCILEQSVSFVRDKFIWLFDISHDNLKRTSSDSRLLEIKSVLDEVIKCAVVSDAPKPVRRIPTVPRIERGDSSSLQQRCVLLEAAIADLEDERSNLLVRATVAEEQLSFFKKRLRN